MEEWKDIPGYKGLYQVSNTGRVRSHYSGTWKIMEQSTRKGGYKKLFLRKNKERKSFFIHRLVATAFIPNPDNLPFVNHKDENPSNNKVENLEWCTHLYNMTYGTCQERARATHLERTPSILMYDKEGILKATFNSVVEAEKETGIPHSNIIACCKGRLKTAKGYVWRYSIQ